MRPLIRNTLMVVFIALVSAPMSLLAQNLSVQGTVTSDDNPGGILGVTVAVSGTANATSTDKSGHYVLRNVKPTDSLVFSFVGFKDQTEAIKGRRQVNIKLERNVSALDQVVVIGYGTAKKKDLTGAISSVNVAKLQNENPTS